MQCQWGSNRAVPGSPLLMQQTGFFSSRRSSFWCCQWLLQGFGFALMALNSHWACWVTAVNVCLSTLAALTLLRFMSKVKQNCKFWCVHISKKCQWPGNWEKDLLLPGKHQFSTVQTNHLLCLLKGSCWNNTQNNLSMRCGLVFSACCTPVLWAQLWALSAHRLESKMFQ